MKKFILVVAENPFGRSMLRSCIANTENEAIKKANDNGYIVRGIEKE